MTFSLQPRDDFLQPLLRRGFCKDDVLEELGKLKLDELLGRDRRQGRHGNYIKHRAHSTDHRSRSNSETNELHELVKGYVAKEIAKSAGLNDTSSAPRLIQSKHSYNTNQARVEQPETESYVRTTRYYITRHKRCRGSR